MITVNLYYTGTGGNARAFAEEMESSGIADKIRQEEGNLRYQYFQPLNQPETVLLIDSWRDQEAIDAHHASPMMVQLAALRDKYDLHMTVERFISDDIVHEHHGGKKPVIVSEMGCCGIYGQHDEAGAQWTEEFQAGYLAKVIDTVTASPEIAGITLWQMNDAKSYHRSGASIRCKPLSQNLAGVYDQYRRPKLAAQTVAEKFENLK